MATLLSAVRFQGSPGDRIYTYAAGTLTPLATWPNQAGTGTPNTNPVICDALGGADIWVGPAAYRIIRKTSTDALISDTDNYLAPLSSSAVTTLIQTTIAPVLAAGASVFDYMTSAEVADVRAGTMSLDHTSSVQTALTAVGELYFPPGKYKISASLVKVTTGSISLRGAGIGITTIFQTANSDLFTLTTSAGTDGQMTVSGMTLCAGTDVTFGAAINILDNPHTPTVTVRDVLIWNAAVPANEFRYGVKTNNCIEAKFINVVYITQKPLPTAAAFYVTSSRTALVSGPVKFQNCSAYGAAVCVDVVNTTNVGVEGVQMQGCDWLGIVGVRCVNTSTYSPPQLTIMGGHMNCSSFNVYVEKYVQVTLLGVLFYNGGSAAAVAFKNVNFFNVSDNQFFGDFGGDPTGIDLTAGGGGSAAGIIANNVFALKSTSPASYCVKVSAACGGRITGNLRQSGAAGFITGDTSGFALKGNSLDAVDNYQSMATAPTINLAPMRSSFINLTASSATTVTAITPRGLDETVTFQCGDANTTFQHNSSLHLKSGTAYNVAPGGTITFKCAGGPTAWFEIGRA